MTNTNQKSSSSPLLIVEYNALGRILAQLLMIFGMYFGFFLVFGVSNIFTIVIGTLFFVTGFTMFISLSLFDTLIFEDDKILIEFNILGFRYIGVEVYYKNMLVGLRKGLFGGQLFLYKKNKRWQLLALSYIDLLPISNKDIKTIKQIFIEKKVIEGNEYSWNF